MSEKFPDAGRPSKFLTHYCDDLIKHMESGLSFESFAAEIDCCASTLYNWTNSNHDSFQPLFLEAKKIAFEKSRKFWETIGVGLATGRLRGGSATAYIFNMKNRFPKEWRDRTELDFGDRANNVFQLAYKTIKTDDE